MFSAFSKKKVSRNITGLKQYNNQCTKEADTYSFNTVYGIPDEIIPDNSIDLVVTSPPYGDSHTTVAYGQFSRWANEWFGFENASNLDSLLMGGKKNVEKKFETKSIINELEQIYQIDHKRFMEVVSFLNDYSASIKHIAPKIRAGGVVCFVVGNRTVKGIQIPLDFFTAEMFEKNGFEHKQTIVREIPNKRMPSKTSPTNKPGQKVSTMSHEYIVILNKI